MPSWLVQDLLLFSASSQLYFSVTDQLPLKRVLLHYLAFTWHWIIMSRYWQSGVVGTGV